MAFEPIDLELPPGVVKKESPRASIGRYVDTQWVRFIKGKPEKIGGFTYYTKQAMRGIIRGLHSWNDLTSRTVLAAGTEVKLYTVDGVKNPVDITPYTSLVADVVSNPITTVNGSKTVTITKASHGLIVGQTINITPAATAVGGITLSGAYIVSTVPTTGTYTVQATIPATSGATGGGSVNFWYEVSPGTAEPAAGYGWGAGSYGKGTYGTPRPTTSTTFEPRFWSLKNFGKLLLAAPSMGKLYSWDPTALNARAQPVGASSPGAMRFMFVTNERFVFALGCSPDTTSAIDPMLVRWADQATIDSWTPSSTGTAAARRLQVGKKLMGGTPCGQNTNLVWSDTALYVFQYTGSRFVYDSRLVAADCGLSGPQAFTTVGGRAFWLSAKGLFQYNGSVSKIPNSDEVQEWILDQIRPYYDFKTLCFYNSRYGEVWFYFVPPGSNEPSAYAVVKVDEWHWVVGANTRTSATTLDGTDSHPLLATTDGFIAVHEDGVDAFGLELPWRLTSGPFEMLNGKRDIDIEGFVPDFERLVGTVSLTVTTKDRPQSPTTMDAQTITFNATTLIEDLRVAGRLATFTMSGGGVGADFRMGKPQFEVTVQGGRR